jgi:hypothetical protein
VLFGQLLSSSGPVCRPPCPLGGHVCVPHQALRGTVASRGLGRRPSSLCCRLRCRFGMGGGSRGRLRGALRSVSRLSSRLLSRLGIARRGGIACCLGVLAGRNSARLGTRGGFLCFISRLACLGSQVCNPRGIGARCSSCGRVGNVVRAFLRCWRLRLWCLSHRALRVTHLGDGRLSSGGMFRGCSVCALGSLRRFQCLFGNGPGSAKRFPDGVVRFTRGLAGRSGCCLRKILRRIGSGGRLRRGSLRAPRGVRSLA